jgi:integrase
MNPAAAVGGPKYVVNVGKAPVLYKPEWRKLFDSIPTDTVRDLRDRALIGTLTYSFAHIGAALKMKIEDFPPQGSGWEILLHEKGGKEHTMACHHELAALLHAYITAAGIAEDRQGWLFRTSSGHNATVLTDEPMNQQAVWHMIRRRAAAAAITAPIGNHTFRATGLTNFLKTAAHSKPARTCRRTQAHKQPGFMTGGNSASNRPRWRGSDCEFPAFGAPEGIRRVPYSTASATLEQRCA